MLAFSLLDARQSECELRFIAEAGVARDLKPRPGGSAIEHHAERALVGDSQRGDRRLAADVEGAASDRNRKPLRIGKRAGEDRGAADRQRVGASAEIGEPGELRRSGPRPRLAAGAKAGVAGVSRIAPPRELVLPRPD